MCLQEALQWNAASTRRNKNTIFASHSSASNHHHLERCQSSNLLLDCRHLQTIWNLQQFTAIHSNSPSLLMPCLAGLGRSQPTTRARPSHPLQAVIVCILGNPRPRLLMYVNFLFHVIFHVISCNSMCCYDLLCSLQVDWTVTVLHFFPVSPPDHPAMARPILVTVVTVVTVGVPNFDHTLCRRHPYTIYI